VKPETSVILLVEDDQNDVLLIQRAFHKAKLLNPLQVVQDGEAAEAYLSGTGPYADREQYPFPVLILMDLKIPRKSGFELLAWIRSQPKLKPLPVVILTSSNLPSDIDRAYDAGANSYLVKPVSFDNLITMVKTLGLYWLVLNEKPTIAEE
jgi:CheY-like chemotaxis protein